MDSQYDIILGSVDAINRTSIKQARQNRADRKRKEEGIELDPAKILVTDLVFRIMTWQHIPLLPPKVPKPGKHSQQRPDSIDRFFKELTEDTTTELDELDVDVADIVPDLVDVQTKTVKGDHVRLNFPPFYHYRIDEDRKPFLVGKSHWIGGFEHGEFSKSHGDMTEKLALMIMKLAEKYALKSNWRNYSYREEMQGQAVLQLCQVALQFDESKSQNPFAFLTQIAHNSFLRILNIEKKNQKLRDDLLIQNSMNPSYSRSNRDAEANYSGSAE